MVNTDFFQDDADHDTPYRIFGLGLGTGLRAHVSIRREHR